MEEKNMQQKEEKRVLFNVESWVSILKDRNDITLEDMLEAGLHVGHYRSHWNPKSKGNIFGLRDNVHMINLLKTKKALAEAIIFLKRIFQDKGTVLFVGTKKQVKNLIKETANFLKMPYVEERWLGGTLTNFSTLKKRMDKLKILEELYQKGELKKYTKKEQAIFKDKITKFNRKMGGIKNLERLPEAIFIVDLKMEKIALQEAHRMKIPVVAIADTNTDPQSVDFPIPANDDAIKAVSFILGYLVLKMQS